MLKAQEIETGLAQHYGSENLYKNRILKFNYTEGVKYMWESCEAYWLLIAISSHNRHEPFQVWQLEVEDHKAVLTMKEDTNEPLKVIQEIPYTDFPLNEIKLYLIDGILLLTSEY
jgi:hypothetical protein